jgi:hypothetical protein
MPSSFRSSISKALSIALATSFSLPGHAIDALSTDAKPAAQVKRPPQYVILAYDGSYTNSTWQHTRNFSKEKKRAGIDTRFTYFINPVYLLDQSNKDFYTAPGKRVIRKNGVKVAVPNVGSAIGYGDNSEDIATRINQMNAAHTRRP